MSDPDSDRDNRTDGTAFLHEMCAPDYELREWLDDVYDNHRRNLSANAKFYERAGRVDGLFQRLLKACRLNLLAIEPSYFLFCRAHSAFLTAVALSLNGQLAEAHMVMRGCIEASLYALQVKRTPTLGQTWLERDHSADTRQAARRAFTARRALDRLRQERPDIAGHVQKLYEDTITYGAHPNIGPSTPASQWSRSRMSARGWRFAT